MTGGQAFQHDIDSGNQPLQHRVSGGAFQIERDAAFVRMQIEKQPTVVAMGYIAREGPVMPETIADAWAFDFDDFRAQIDPQLSGKADGNPLATFQCPKPS